MKSERGILPIHVMLVINIFLAGVGWGSVYIRVGNLEARVERIESHEDKRLASEARQSHIIGPYEAWADTIPSYRGFSNERTPSSSTISTKEAPKIAGSYRHPRSSGSPTPD